MKLWLVGVDAVCYRRQGHEFGPIEVFAAKVQGKKVTPTAKVHWAMDSEGPYDSRALCGFLPNRALKHYWPPSGLYDTVDCGRCLNLMTQLLESNAAYLGEEGGAWDAWEASRTRGHQKQLISPSLCACWPKPPDEPQAPKPQMPSHRLGHSHAQFLRHAGEWWVIGPDTEVIEGSDVLIYRHSHRDFASVTCGEIQTERTVRHRDGTSTRYVLARIEREQAVPYTERRTPQ